MGREATEAKYPMPKGPEVEMYLGPSVRGATIVNSNGEAPILRVGINGYNYDLKMGEKNKVPRDVYELLLTSKSKTTVPDVDKAERAPRPDGLGYHKELNQCDYDVVLIKEG